MRVSVAWLGEYVDLAVLGSDVDPIADALTALGLAVDLVEPVGDDTVLEVDVTTNRPDCLNHLGLARELSAYYRLPLQLPDFSPVTGSEELAERFPFDIRIEDPQLCPRYAGRVVTGVKVAPSPRWLQQRLEAIGQRPLNNVVDITNYVLFAVGHPLHAFDYHKLREHRIVVRRARAGECIRTLDGVNREATPEMLMICDAKAPVAVAGVMGGEATEISGNTTAVLLESAYFDPVSVRRTAKRLGLSTEASYRFERGADPEMPVKALNLATRMIVKICGGQCAGEVRDVYPMPVASPELSVRLDRIERVLGLAIPKEDAEPILRGLEFAPRWDGERRAFTVSVPSFRRDVSLEDDLVEEVARHFGYDRIPSAYPPATEPGRDLPWAEKEERVCRVLLGSGFSQAINYSFTSPEREARVLGLEDELVPLLNPLSEADSHLRRTLLTGLVESVRRNLNVGLRDIRLFEIGKTYHRSASDGGVVEVDRLGVVAIGAYHDPYFASYREEFGFFHLKGLLEAVLGDLGCGVQFEPGSAPSFFHPGAVAAVVSQEGDHLGWAGELHPRRSEALKLPARLYLAEFELGRLWALPLPEPRFRPLSRFPSVTRDLSFLVDKSTPYGKIASLVQELGIPELVGVRLIDLYRGRSLPVDKVSLTVRLTFEAPDRTLTQAEVAGACERIVGALVEQFGIQPR